MLLLFGSLLGCKGFQFHTSLAGQETQRFREVPAFLFHDKTEDIAAFTALAKTTPGAALGRYDEGRSLLAVERAQSRVILSRPAQFDRLSNEFNDIDTGFYLIYLGHVVMEL